MKRELTKKVEEFYNSMKNVSDHRYRSWEHCHHFFINLKNKKRISKLTNKDLNLAQLHLAFYLASWGMYRGSSFILQKDYTIFKDIVSELLSNKYLPLWDLKNHLNKKEELNNLFIDLYNNLEHPLKNIRSTILNHDNLREDVKKRFAKEIISDTLITKIILGTIGCIPAYDQYFKAGLKKKGEQQKFKIDKSFLLFLDYYNSKQEEIDLLAKKYNYTPMKIIDMYFWEIGGEIK